MTTVHATLYFGNPINLNFVDLSGTDNYLEALENHAAATGSSVFGITTTTPQLPRMANRVGANAPLL